MAINYELLNKGGISLGTNFELLSEKPLDSRLVVPSLDGLQNYIDNAAAYEGLIAYVSSEKKHYEVKVIDGVLSYRPFGLTEAELNDLITNATTAAMEFKGATATLPENPAKGDMYKVAGENINIKIDDVDAKLGDSIVYDGEKWFLIPSGDDIEDTWRPVDGVNNDATLKFVDGDKTVASVAADGTIKYNHATVAAPADVTAEGDEKTRTYITAVETDGYGHITGYKTATENVEDTNTTYEFEGQTEESSVYFQVTASEDGADAEVVYLDAYSKNEADGKFVAKETGKSLVSDDEIARLADVDNYDDEEVRGLIGDNAKAIEDLETYVGTIPNVSDENGNNKYADLDVIGYINKKAQETLAAASGNSSETAASVKQQLDDYIGENNTRFKAVEDDINAINNADTGILKQAKDYADGLAGNYDEAGAAAGVKSELSGEIAKKVDAVEGKDLIATSEIERLATLANYDDTQVKADIAKKADAETMTTELGKKVDKVEGYSLVSDTEIARLADVDNYDDTQVKADIAKKADAATMTTELGKKVDKVDGFSLVSDTEIARLADVDNYDDEEVRGLIGDNAKAIEDLETYVGTIPAGATATDIVGYVQEKTAGIATEGAMTELGNRITVVEGDVATIKGDYLKAADIANFETKENVKKVADDLAAYVESNDEALAGVKATAEAARTEDEVNSQIDAKITALNLGTTYEPIGAEDRAKAYVDGKFTDANLDQYTTEAEVKSIVDGVIAGAADSETYNSLTKLVDYIDAHGGEASEMAQAIETLEGDVKGLKEAPSAGIKATDIAAWNGEIGAKALAETKLDASTFTEYSNAHADDYTNKQIDDAIDADVKAAIDAEVLRANGAYDTKGAAADAQAAAIADAAGKYETQGTAQGIVDALKLSETYEPIGAEGRAIAAAEAKVKALADGQVKTNTEAIATKANAADVYAKTETFTKDEVNAAIAAAVEAAHTWGEF